MAAYADEVDRVVENDMPEWAEYFCKVPKKQSDDLPSNCVTFSEVSHIAHLREAKRILMDGRIICSPVDSGSRLSGTGTPVTWLSANTWGRGSVHGTVGFVFDWKDVLVGRKMYWVEVEDSYRWEAYRFLLTANEPPKHDEIRLYDPRKDKGPVRRRRGAWYRRSNEVSHFLVEGDLPLNLCKKIDFVSHLECKRMQGGVSCAEKGVLSQVANLRLMAFILGNSIHSADDALSPEREQSLPDFGIQNLASELRDNVRKGRGRVRKGRLAEALLRGALLLYDAGLAREAKYLLGQLANYRVLDRTLEKLVENHFAISKYRIR